MRKIVMWTGVVCLAGVAAGCATTSGQTASNTDKMHERLVNRDRLIQASDQRRLEAAMVSAETRSQQENQAGASANP